MDSSPTKVATASLAEKTEPGIGDVVDAAAAAAFSPLVLRRLKHKADFILLPLLTITYLLNSLDRSNPSNAKTAGLTTDLGLVGNQDNQILTYCYSLPLVVPGPVPLEEPNKERICQATPFS